MHHDPDTWIEPMKYEPDRYDFSHSDNKWSKDANGKSRNPLAFNPWFGGKRVKVTGRVLRMFEAHWEEDTGGAGASGD